MTGLTLTTTREVTPEEVDDLIDLVDFSRSPWFKSIDTVIGGTSYLIEHDTREKDGITDTTQIDSQQLLDAITKAQSQLCCFGVYDELFELGNLCANDADIILQTAVFGRIIFG